MTARRTLFTALLAVALCAGASPARAGWQDNVLDALGFTLGIVTGYAVHEVGHALAAKAYGEQLDWSHGEWNCRAPCEHLDQVAIAGNLATAIVGEALLRLPPDRRETPYVDGLQAFNTINPISYAAKDLRSDAGYGDYAHVNNAAEVTLAIHAATIGYRQFSGRLWRVTPTARGVQFNARF